MPRCSACQAEIKWIETENGKNTPLDAKPEKRWVKYIIMGRKGNETRWKLVDTYMPHHATCPEVDKFRKSKPKCQ